MGDVEGAEVELSHEQRKEEEQAVIQKKIEETEAQIERLDMMETGAGLKDMTLQELAVNNSFKRAGVSAVIPEIELAIACQ